MATTCVCGKSTFLRYVSRDNVPANGEGRLLGIYCKCCHAEWLLEQFVSDRDPGYVNTQQFEGQTLHRRTQSCSQISLDHPTFSDFTPGDQITWFRGYGIVHHAIVVAVNPTDMHIIEFTTHKCTCTGCGCRGCCDCHASDDGVCCDCCRILETAIVNPGEHPACCTVICKGMPYRAVYPEDVRRYNPTELILARAFALKDSLGLHWCGYSLLRNNCEHFSTFCKSGAPSSQQSGALRSALIRAIAAGLRSPFTFLFIKLIALFAGEAVENFMTNLPRYDWVGPAIAIGINFLVLLIELCCMCRRRKRDYRDCGHMSCHMLMEFIFASGLIFVAGFYGERFGRFVAGYIENKHGKTAIEIVIAVTAGFIGNLLGIWIGKSLNQSACNCIIYTGCCDCCSECCQCCERLGYGISQDMSSQGAPLLP